MFVPGYALAKVARIVGAALNENFADTEHLFGEAHLRVVKGVEEEARIRGERGTLEEFFYQVRIVGQRVVGFRPKLPEAVCGGLPYFFVGIAEEAT